MAPDLLFSFIDLYLWFVGLEWIFEMLDVHFHEIHAVGECILLWCDYVGLLFWCSVICCGLVLPLVYCSDLVVMQLHMRMAFGLFFVVPSAGLVIWGLSGCLCLLFGLGCTACLSWCNRHLLIAARLLLRCCWWDFCTGWSAVQLVLSSVIAAAPTSYLLLSIWCSKLLLMSIWSTVVLLLSIWFTVVLLQCFGYDPSSTTPTSAMHLLLWWYGLLIPYWMVLYGWCMMMLLATWEFLLAATCCWCAAYNAVLILLKLIWCYCWKYEAEWMLMLASVLLICCCWHFASYWYMIHDEFKLFVGFHFDASLFGLFHVYSNLVLLVFL